VCKKKLADFCLLLQGGYSEAQVFFPPSLVNRISFLLFLLPNKLTPPEEKTKKQGEEEEVEEERWRERKTLVIFTSQEEARAVNHARAVNFNEATNKHAVSEVQNCSLYSVPFIHSSSSSSSRLVAQLNFNRQSRRISNSKTLEIIRLKLTYFTAHISHQVDRSRSSSSSHLPSPTSPVPKFTVQKLLQG
jgi:hypothetical protein